MKRIVSIILVVCCLFSFTVYGDDMADIEKREYYDKIIDKEIDFIKSLVLDCGAIGMYKPKSSKVSISLPFTDGISPDVYGKWENAKVVPYYSHAAVLGLMECDEVRNTFFGKEISLNYINWYISHMNEKDVNGVKGTVYDYYIFQSEGKTVEVPTEDYDSTDSYAALFIEVLDTYSRVYDREFLKGKADTIGTLVDVMLSTYVNELNLTTAKTTYPMCYLMDNCEVYRGFICAESIYREYLNDKEKAEACGNYAGKVKQAILKAFWMEDKGIFTAGAFENGKNAYATGDTTAFYPHGACQLYPVIFGVVQPNDKKAVEAYNYFKENYCLKGVNGRDWSLFDINGESFPWCSLLRCVVKMGDFKLAQRFVKVMCSRFVNKFHPSPFYCYESGCLLSAISDIYLLTDTSAKEYETISEASEEADYAEISEASENPSYNTDKTNALPFIIGGILVLCGAAVFFFKRKKTHKYITTES